MTTKTLIQQISLALNARNTCKAHGGNGEWQSRWEERLESIAKNELPSGSGFDSGTKLDFDASTDDCIVFTTAFHHMNDNGYYCGWTEHTVKVRPSFIHGFTLTVSGRNYRDIKGNIKDTITDMFSYALGCEYSFPVETA